MFTNEQVRQRVGWALIDNHAVQLAVEVSFRTAFHVLRLVWPRSSRRIRFAS